MKIFLENNQQEKEQQHIINNITRAFLESDFDFDEDEKKKVLTGLKKLIFSLFSHYWNICGEYQPNKNYCITKSQPLKDELLDVVIQEKVFHSRIGDRIECNIELMIRSFSTGKKVIISEYSHSEELSKDNFFYEYIHSIKGEVDFILSLLKGKRIGFCDSLYYEKVDIDPVWNKNDFIRAAVAFE